MYEVSDPEVRNKNAPFSHEKLATLQGGKMDSTRTEDQRLELVAVLPLGVIEYDFYSLRKGLEMLSEEARDLVHVQDHYWPSRRKERLIKFLPAVGKCHDTKRLQVDIADADVLNSQEWDSFFESLLSNPIMEKLRIKYTGALYSAVCTHIGAFLAGSLEVLKIKCTPPTRASEPLTDAALRALSEGLARSKCLRELRLFGEGRSMTDLLTTVFDFSGELRNESLKYIYLNATMEGVEMALPFLLSRRFQNLESITLGLEDLEQSSADRLRRLGDCLRTLPQTAVPIRKVLIYIEYAERDSHKWTSIFHNCRNLLEAIEGAPMVLIRIPLAAEEYLLGGIKHLSFTWFAQDLNRNNQLRGLHLDVHYMRSILFKSIGPAITCGEHLPIVISALSAIDSVESLSFSSRIGRMQMKESSWKQLFEGLHHRTRLKHISLKGLDVSDAVFRDLMDLLQVNIYLEEIDLWNAEWEDDGKAVLVREALRQNRAQAAYFSTLANAGFDFHDARAGRIFLCGSPHAGKTKLRTTMMMTRNRKSKGKLLAESRKRTKGVDVELLRDDEMQVSIWKSSEPCKVFFFRPLLKPVCSSLSSAPSRTTKVKGKMT